MAPTLLQVDFVHLIKVDLQLKLKQSHLKTLSNMQNIPKEAAHLSPNMYEKDIHRWDKEGDPAHHDEHGAGEVDGEDEGAEWPGQADLKPVHAVVAWRYELSDMSN